MFEGSDVFASPALSYYKLNSSAEFMENNKKLFHENKTNFSCSSEHEKLYSPDI